MSISDSARRVATTHGEGADAGERFEVRGKLGAGGVGVVYRAYDRRRGTEVALKTLLQVTGADLYRFKREFRILADVRHPNLVGLHGLHTRGDEWFLTMELIDGVPFIDWVRPPERGGDAGAPAEAPDTVEDATVPSGSRPGSRDADRFGATTPTQASGSRPSQLFGARQRIIAAPLDLERLESALYQLVDTVHALHSVGKLHRDLKPSNVLVEASGRVVVLDFGLIADIEPRAPERVHASSEAIGTPAYMSPEQAADLELTPASDWFTVGVMLYEALTGRRPVEVIGPRPEDIVHLPAPHSFAPATPAHLDRLCMRLLQLDPDARPDGHEVLAALGRAPSPASRSLARHLERAPFVGRARELAALEGALAEVRGGACVAVFVRGPSGMGKSSLLRRFTEDAAVSHGAVVLRGRCFERESVPFKTLDGVIDALATYLLSLPPAQLAGLVPRELGALARLFPVFSRVTEVAGPAEPAALPPDPLELRRRAFLALRQLLGALSARTPIVLAVDDVQWGDADSGHFFAELLELPDAPALLLVFCHRSEDEDVTPLLAALRKVRRAPTRDLTLGPLAEDEARQLAASLGRSDAAWVAGAVRESGGSPMFLSELVQAGGAAGGNLEDVIAARLVQQPEGARALLTVCAAAARPLHSSVALAAAGLEGEGALVAGLVGERLLRVRHPEAGRSELETYHDRIRATIMGRLPEEERRRVHARLGEAIEASPDADEDREALVVHFVEAGEPERAARHARDAAHAAEARLAFHRAADLYALALTHGRHDDDTRRLLRTRLAHALAYAGRLDESAATFALAAADAPPHEKLELERLSLEQLLRGGHLHQGVDKTRTVLAAVGERLPTSRVGAIASLLGLRALLNLRGTRFEERAGPPSPARRQKNDILWSVSSGLSFANPVYGQVLQMRYLRAALATRDLRHIGRAFTLELGYLGMRGAGERAKLDLLHQRAVAIGERLGDPELVGVARAGGGLASFLCGFWRESHERFVAAERVLRDECTHVRWQLDLLESFQASNLWYLGETRELARVVPAWVRAAEERGDMFALRGLRGWRANNLWLILDRPDEALVNVESVALAREPGEPMQLTHWFELMAHVHNDLYRGRVEQAHARVESSWRDLRRSMLMRIQNVHIEALFLRARATLALAARADDDARARHVQAAQAAARRLEATHAAWAVPFARLVRARAADLAEDPARADALLRAAIEDFDANDMALYAMATRVRLAELVGGDEGAELRRHSAAFFRAQAIVNPAALVAMLAP